jgi:hypothetical protein
MNSTMRNPNMLQAAMKRIMKRLQDKFQRGEFKPQELAAEAEEMMKEFSENPAFVDMMDSMRKAFSFEGNMEGAKAAGQEHTARMNIVKERLRRKQAEKAAARGSTPAPVNTLVPEVEESEDFPSILLNSKQSNNKKQSKK